jgi:Predicted cobalamin binding protein
MLSSKGVDFGTILRRYDVESENSATPESIAKKLLPSDPIFKKCAEDVLYMKFRDVMATVKEALNTKDPLEVINKGLVAGMEIVSALYAQHIYYLPEIMLAAKTMEIGIAVAEKNIPGGRQTKGLVVMHAAEGDPHDIGKNIAAVMMRSAGYTVEDMGRDVPVVDVVAKVEELKPFLVTGTALMTTTMSAFPAVAKKLQEKGINIPLMAAGGAVNRDFAESFELGIYSEKAPQTPPIAAKILAGYDWKKIRAEWDEIVGGE